CARGYSSGYFAYW
nr:immunoglobulin heavy chain junction region [Mus musculus]